MSDYLNFLEKKSRFMAWLIIFLILLMFIPVLIMIDLAFLAKCFGFIVIILVSVALFRWRTQTARQIRKSSRVKMTLNERFWLDRHIHFYHLLSKTDKIIFEDRIGLFLAEIKITEIGKKIPEKDVCLYVASSAIIAYWGLPYWNYGELVEVLVYPDNFTMENQIDSKGNIEGKVFQGGLMDSTMILSLPALINDFKLSKDRKNVGIHEFSHLLDKDDGIMDGSLPLFNNEQGVKWFDLLKSEIRNVKNKKSDINPYAAKSNAEFFAVIMEYYRENPEKLKKKHPQLFNFLESKLNQSDG